MMRRLYGIYLVLISIHSRFFVKLRKPKFRALDQNIQRLKIRITIQLFLLNRIYILNIYHNTVPALKAENYSIFGEKQNKIIVPTFYSLILKN